MTCLLNYGGGKLEINGIIGPFDCSLLMGLSEMSFGILTAAFWQRKSENVLNHKYGTALLNAISILCSFAFILLTIIQPCYDRYILIIAFFVIIGCLSLFRAVSCAFCHNESARPIFGARPRLVGVRRIYSHGVYCCNYA